VVIFDQFEELFTFYPERWQDREGFFVRVSDALEGDPLLRVVFVMREDHIAQLDPYTPLLPEKLRTRFRLERLRKRATLSAVTGPLAEAKPKRSFAEGVAEQLVEELLKVRVETTAGKPKVVTGEFVEPVQLQVVCQSLWRDLPSDVTAITQDDLQAFGDVNQALSGFYERSIERAAQKAGVREGDLRSWFEGILITPAGTRGMVYRGREKTGGIPNAAVGVFENLHLIRGEWRAGARWYELTHDRFIEPIQGSNKAWKEKRRRTLFTALGTAVAVLIVGVMLAFATTWTVQQRAQATAQAQVQATAAAVAAEATAAAAEVSELAGSGLQARVRPLKPGLSVGEVHIITASTIGAFVRDAKGQFYLLTASTVLGGPTICELDSPVVQPGRYDGGTLDDVVGYVAKCLPFGKENPPANDVGLARLKEGVTFETAIPGIGSIRGVREPTLGMNVRKVGRTTGLTTGRIIQVDATVQMSYGTAGVFTFVDCAIADGMSAGGDSGALVVDEEGYAIGVIIGGLHIIHDDVQTTTILAPIQDVLDRLDVELVGIVP
jgi:hypothetical protein